MKPRRYMSDLYEGNPTFEPEKYAMSGRALIALKASEGIGHVDSKHAFRTRGAHLNGLTVLHYHFARPDMATSPGAEAAHFIRVVKPLWIPGDYLCCDIERGTAPGHEPVAKWVQEFVNHCRAMFHATPIVYANESTLNGSLRTLVVPGQRYWVAKYGAGDPVLGGSKRQWAWQYTDGQAGKQPHTAPGIGTGDNSIVNLPTAVRCSVRARRRRWLLSH